jgi:hypothetical protein
MVSLHPTPITTLLNFSDLLETGVGIDRKVPSPLAKHGGFDTSSSSSFFF